MVEYQYKKVVAQAKENGAMITTSAVTAVYDEKIKENDQ
jgi:hypothetical protein